MINGERPSDIIQILSDLKIFNPVCLPSDVRNYGRNTIPRFEQNFTRILPFINFFFN